MKIKLFIGIFLLWAALGRAQSNSLTALLQQGLIAEQATRNLDAAIADYSALAAKFDQDRQIAATAVFRLGECYRAQGRTNEAAAQYQRILRDFSDQATLASLSQQDLIGMGMVKTEATAAPVSASPDAQLWNRLKDASQSELEKLLPTLMPDAVLDQLLQLRSRTQNELTVLSVDYGPENVKVTRLVTLLNVLNSQIHEKIDAMMQALKLRAEFSPPSPSLVAARAPSAEVEELARTEKILAQLQGWDLSQLRHLIPTLVPDAEFERLDKQLQVFEAFGDPAPDNIATHRADMESKLAERAAQINKQLQMRADHLKELIASQTPDHQTAGPAAENGGRVTAVPVVSDEEDKEIARIQTMIQNSPDLINAAQGGETPLDHAAAAGWLRVTAYLLDHGAAMDYRALINATSNGNKTMVEFLLAHGAHVNATDTTGGTALHQAAEAGYLSVAAVLIKNHANLEARNAPANGEETPLLSAVSKGRPAMVTLLLSNGVNVNAVNHSGRTSVMQAVAGGYAEILNKLIQAGAKLDVEDEHGNTALTYAVQRNDVVFIIKALLAAKADPNAGKAGTTILKALDRPQNLKLLLAAGADPNINIGKDGTPLLVAIQNDQSDGIALLLQAGARVNTTLEDGTTPLQMAVWRQDIPVISLLLSNNVDINARHSSGLTALAISKEAERGWSSPRPDSGGHVTRVPDPATARKISALLREHGALDNLPDWNRITVSRPANNYSASVFEKGTNDWNHFTVLELFQAASRNDLPFPDLAHIVVVRPSAAGGTAKRIVVNLLNDTNQLDCSRDVSLEFGDMVEIPEREHALSEPSDFLSGEQWSVLWDHFQRIAGEATLKVAEGKTVQLPLPIFQSQISQVLRSSAAGAALTSSCDLSRVKVTRRDAKTGKVKEWTLDCSYLQPSPGGISPAGTLGIAGSGTLALMNNNMSLNSGPASDQELILRAGDVIQVPLKP